MNKRYIAKIFKRQRGYGILSVHAKSLLEAKKMVTIIAHKKGAICNDVESFRSFERKIRRDAVNDYIYRNSPLMRIL
jgi:hypothetical protein